MSILWLRGATAEEYSLFEQGWKRSSFGDIDRVWFCKQTKMKFYQYEKCESCRKAKKWRRKRIILWKLFNPRDASSENWRRCSCPSRSNQKAFNSSGKDYRDKEIKSILPTMSEEEIISLPASRGNLTKRPFLIGNGIYLQGFKPELWKEAFEKGTRL